MQLPILLLGSLDLFVVQMSEGILYSAILTVVAQIILPTYKQKAVVVQVGLPTYRSCYCVC